MTRNELIEALSQAIQSVPMVHTGGDTHPPSVRIAAAALAAIEAQGMAIVPVEPDDAFWDRVDAHSGRHSRSGETYPVQRNFHRAMIEAAKL